MQAKEINFRIGANIICSITCWSVSVDALTNWCSDSVSITTPAHIVVGWCNTHARLWLCIFGPGSAHSRAIASLWVWPTLQVSCHTSGQWHRPIRLRMWRQMLSWTVFVTSGVVLGYVLCLVLFWVMCDVWYCFGFCVMYIDANLYWSTPVRLWTKIHKKSISKDGEPTILNSRLHTKKDYFNKNNFITTAPTIYNTITHNVHLTPTIYNTITHNVHLTPTIYNTITHNVHLTPTIYNTITHNVHLTPTIYNTITHNVHLTPTIYNTITHNVHLTPTIYNTITHNVHLTPTIYNTITHNVHLTPTIYNTITHSIHLTPTIYNTITHSFFVGGSISVNFRM